MSVEEVVLYKNEKGIVTLTLNRPEALNALNRDVLTQLSTILDRIKADPSVKAVILTGAGEKAFSAGADISYLHQATPLEVRDFAQLAVSVTSQIESLGKVVVAAINGYALGGGLEIAESCSLRIAVQHAKMGHPEVRIGAVAGFGGTTRLPRLIGKGRAAELLLTGSAIDADEAYRMGLVNRVVSSERLLAETEEVLREILSQSPLAVKLTWDAIHRGSNLTVEESALLGADYFGLVASTEDFREGTKAFLDKTKPHFTGR
ncbi:enoyl-CoA hydratase/isomerase family protein [Brevibacillus sp. Leaf182]|uniref:enoyl-CoA hydratase/isomerase family protein n=1 Tax=Brevibacillus sp. Leaf182 TaxID=1736290 RepID=UPI0006F2F267|nr:enoyl-CoA hydratase-related protein [Brevibacillus sp. Leaf182]RAT94547.1 enoyl-CoA hydratase [Brevibacillus sp. Leaf182]